MATRKELLKISKGTWWKKGAPSPNPSGRPHKFVSKMQKDFGYTHAQVIDTLKNLTAMDDIALNVVVKSKDATALEGTVAVALLKARKSGDLHKIEMVLTRAFGAPKQYIHTDAPLEQDAALQIDWSKLSSSALKEIANAQIKVDSSPTPLRKRK